jgi:N-acylneuraminate cytidylyltransferase
MGEVVAIIPAREEQEGHTDRDLRELKGTSLVEIAIRQALGSELITHVVVNSDSERVRGEAEGYDVTAYERPERFAGDDRVMQVDRLLCWQVDRLEQDGGDVDIVVLLFPIAPLRTVDHIDETVRTVRDGPYESALTLYEDTRYIWEHAGDEVVAVNYDPMKRYPRELRAWNQLVENKAVYAVRRDTLLRTGSRLGGTTGGVEMPQYRSFMIRTQQDFELVKFIAEVDGVSW